MDSSRKIFRLINIDILVEYSQMYIVNVNRFHLYIQRITIKTSFHANMIPKKICLSLDPRRIQFIQIA